MVPLVSISVITYNHGSFIEKCIEGLLMQKTSFDYEILINDDASTDDTINIIKLYQRKFPSIIKPIFQIENQYSKGQRGMNVKYNFPRAEGKYIALCEGDDYWTDPLKLEKQVNFLNSNPLYSACFTNAVIINSSRNSRDNFLPLGEDITYASSEIISKGGGLFPTASLLFRNNIAHWPEFMFKYQSGDRALSLLLSCKGLFYLLNEQTCIYNIHEGGVFSSILENQIKRSETNLEDIKLLNDFNQYTDNKFSEQIERSISLLAKTAILSNPNLIKDQRFFYIFNYMSFKDKLSMIFNLIKLR